MIVYDKELLENTYLFAEAKKRNEEGFISDEQLADIKKQLRVLKSHNNILIRIGFYLLGTMLLSSLMGVISLFALGAASSNYWVLTFLYFLMAFAGSEILTKQQDQFGYGLDDAFILGFQAFLCATIGIAFESPMAALITYSIIGLLAGIRYVHTVSILFSLIAFTGTVCYAVLELKVIGSAFLPFILFFLAIVFYFIYSKINKDSRLYYYENAIAVLQGFSLILGYFSLNYLVVRELSEALLNVTVLPGQDISFAFLFYGFTFLIPLFYLVYSLYSKDRLMLSIGLLTFGFSIYTIRFYYHILPIEVAMILGGILLFAIAYFSIKKIKDNEKGITFKRARGADSDILPNIEALIVSTQVDLKTTESQSKMPFGGGGFSGGGAGESF